MTDRSDQHYRHGSHTPVWTDGPHHHYLHATTYAKVDGLMPFLHATAMSSIRQNGRTNKSMTTSMPPHTLKWMALCHSCTRPPYHPYAKLYGLIPFLHATAMPPIRQNGRTEHRSPRATQSPKWKDLYHSCTRPPCHVYAELDEPIRTSLPPWHPYVKMDGITLLHANAMPPIRQSGQRNQYITTSMPPHTPKWMDIHNSCTRTLCHPYAKMDGPFRTSLPPCHLLRQNGWT
jgi:hypothetical protein